MARTFQCYECRSIKTISVAVVCTDHTSQISKTQIDWEICEKCYPVHQARHAKGDFR